MSIFSKLLGRGGDKLQPKPAVHSGREPQAIRTTADAPFRILNPIVGFVCVTPEHRELMEADKAVIGPLFSECRSSTNAIVPCHVLFLYCNVGESGDLQGLQMRIRDFVKGAGACIAVVASENDGAHYMQALNPKNEWPANIVLVVERRDSIFASFFEKLFADMKSGTSMLMAWVRLAPQIPGQDHVDCPVTFMAAEAGHIAFGESA